MKREKPVTGIDIGNSTICAVIGRSDSEGRIDVHGAGCAPSRGICRGSVVEPERVCDSVEEAVNRAEERAGLRVQSAFVSISNPEVESHRHRETVKVSDQERGIRRQDVERAMCLVDSVTVPLKRKILNRFLQGYIVDDQTGVRNVLGMFGSRLGIEQLFVTADGSAVEKFAYCLNQIGIETEAVIPSVFAASYSTLSENERNAGVILLDMGRSTTQAIVFVEGTVRKITVIPRGGDYLTGRIISHLNVDFSEGEKIKKFLNDGREGQDLNSRKDLQRIIEAGMKEIFKEIRQNLEDTIASMPPLSGLTITGGGSLFKGAAEAAEEVFNFPARVGVSRRVRGAEEIIIDPVSSAAVGLIGYGTERALKGRGWMQRIPAVRRLALHFNDLVEEYF